MQGLCFFQLPSLQFSPTVHTNLVRFVPYAAVRPVLPHGESAFAMRGGRKTNLAGFSGALVQREKLVFGRWDMVQPRTLDLLIRIISIRIVLYVIWASQNFD